MVPAPAVEPEEAELVPPVPAPALFDDAGAVGYECPDGPDAVWLAPGVMTPVGLELAELPPPGAAVFCGDPEVPVHA